MFECDCCGREVVPKKLPGIGYYCDPCLRGSTMDEYPWTMSDEMYANYLRVHGGHAEVCEKARRAGPMKQ
jgi:hypothetical protein